MPDAKTRILSRVRQAQSKARLPEPQADLPEKLVYPNLDLHDCMERLLREFEALGVIAFVEPLEDGVRSRVRGLLQGKSILSWDADRLPYGLASALKDLPVVYGKSSTQEQAKAEIGLTGCDAALAETGTLALLSGPGKPRQASLLPFIHVAVVRSADIVYGLGEFLDRDVVRNGAEYLTLITGPSRTADIELSLTKGVHGPGQVIVVIGP